MNVAEASIENVSDTAFWIAHYRAAETERADALFRDPLAGLLSGERGKQIARGMPGTMMTAWAVAVRTCLIDDYIRFALAQGVDMVLNLGAGLDTRPYRMDLPPSLLWVEADYPAMIEFKQSRLAGQTPHCQLERVKLDLGNPPERQQLLSNAQASSKKLLVLTEGVVPYLTVEQVASLADDLYALEPACYWIVDYFSPQMFKYRKRMSKGKLRNAPFKFDPPDWFGFFEKHRWRCKQMRYLIEEGERLNRPMKLSPLVKLILAIRAPFVSAERRTAFRQFAGYVLLERGN
jgi:methyltransferase (TIGR00027 family)